MNNADLVYYKGYVYDIPRDQIKDLTSEKIEKLIKKSIKREIIGIPDWKDLHVLSSSEFELEDSDWGDRVIYNK